jgi:hypothetical protein
MSNPDKTVNVLETPFSDYLTRYQKKPKEIEGIDQSKIDDILERLDRIEKGIKSLTGLQLIKGVWR